MGSQKQAGKQNAKRDRRIIKIKMLDRLTVRDLAARIGHHESVVSRAINHGRFPRVRQKILEALHV